MGKAPECCSIRIPMKRSQAAHDGTVQHDGTVAFAVFPTNSASRRSGRGWDRPGIVPHCHWRPNGILERVFDLGAVERLRPAGFKLATGRAQRLCQSAPPPHGPNLSSNADALFRAWWTACR